MKELCNICCLHHDLSSRHKIQWCI